MTQNVKIISSASKWDDFGPDDQLQWFNLLIEENTLQAAQEIKTRKAFFV